MFPAFLCHSAIFYDSHHAGSTFCRLQWWHCVHKCRIRARDRRDNENLHAHRLALLVQRFHRHKFITTPGPQHIAGNVIVLPNAVAVDLICNACCCNGDATHSSIAPNETVHNIPATSATSAIRKIENPMLRMAVSSLFFDNCPRPTIPPNKAINGESSTSVRGKVISTTSTA